MAAVHALRRYGRFGLCMVYYMRAEDRAQEKDAESEKDGYRII